jgi:hypothetical protein
MADGFKRDWSSMAVRRIGLAAAVLLAAGLAGCGTISDETLARATAAPGRFDLYTCAELDTQIKVTRTRQIELEQLMARAEQGGGGAFVSAIAYRSEYVQARGQLMDLNRTASDRRCAIDNKYSSGRAVF